MSLRAATVRGLVRSPSAGVFRAGQILKYGYLTGVSGAYFSTPDSAAVSVTTNILIEADITPASWASGANQMICSKCHNSGQYSYQLFILPAGGLRISGSANGTTFTLDATSSEAVSFTANTRGYIRATRQSSSGDVKFYTSRNGFDWTQLGVTRSTPAAAYFDGTDIVELGTNVGGTNNRLTGRINRLRIYNTYDSAISPVADFNPLRYTGGTTLTASTGEVWTLNGAAKILAQEL